VRGIWEGMKRWSGQGDAVASSVWAGAQELLKDPRRKRLYPLPAPDRFSVRIQ